jgi:hypothetical protein
MWIADEVSIPTRRDTDLIGNRQSLGDGTDLITLNPSKPLVILRVTSFRTLKYDSVSEITIASCERMAEEMEECA